MRRRNRGQNAENVLLSMGDSSMARDSVMEENAALNARIHYRQATGDGITRKRFLMQLYTTTL